MHQQVRIGGTPSSGGVPDVRNSWVLLAAVAVVSLGGAVVYASVGETSPVIAGYFLVGSGAVAALGFWWFSTHPPAMRGPRWAYYAVVIGLIVGAFGAGGIPGTRSVGAWIVVGVGFVAFGALERSALIATAGGVTAVAGVVGLVLAVPALGIWLELFTAATFGLAAALLRTQRTRLQYG